MDWPFITAATIVFGLTAVVLWITFAISRKGKHVRREIGYRRQEIEINPAHVPTFKPTWHEMQRNSHIEPRDLK
jgi:hypothetical protein